MTCIDLIICLKEKWNSFFIQHLLSENFNVIYQHPSSRCMGDEVANSSFTLQIMKNETWRCEAARLETNFDLIMITGLLLIIATIALASKSALAPAIVLCILSYTHASLFLPFIRFFCLKSTYKTATSLYKMVNNLRKRLKPLA